MKKIISSKKVQKPKAHDTFVEGEPSELFDSIAPKIAEEASKKQIRQLDIKIGSSLRKNRKNESRIMIRIIIRLI